jgi:hypothetical protein
VDNWTSDVRYWIDCHVCFQCSNNDPNSFLSDSLRGSHFGCGRVEKSPGTKARLRGKILLIFQWPKLNRECLSSIPPKAASHSRLWPNFPRDPGMGRKSRLFALSLWSPDSRFAEHEAQIAESLRPFRQIFPFWGDYRRRLVRSRLPPRFVRKLWTSLDAQRSFFDSPLMIGLDDS